MKTFIGSDGHYDIYHNGKIVLRITDEIGKLTGNIKTYTDARSINNDADRNGVLHLLQVMRIYRAITSKA